MASLYEFTCDTFSTSSSASIHSIYDPEKYASVPKSLYEYNIPIDIDADADVCAFEAPDFPLYTCNSEDEKHKAESTPPNTIIFESSDPNSDSDSEVGDVNVIAPPAYTVEPPSKSNNSTAAPTNGKRSLFRLASLLSSCLGLRTRSRSTSSPTASDAAQSVPPPPYVSKEEIELMEERMRQLDIFFGGAPL